MKHAAFPIAAILVLGACARVEPIDLNEVAEVEPIAVDNSIAEEPAIDSSLVWQVDGPGQQAPRRSEQRAAHVRAEPSDRAAVRRGEPDPLGEL